MKIVLADHSGFCMGVRNAILKIVHEIDLSKEEIYVYGPLIHNPQTIKVLNDRGLKTIDSLDNISGKQITIRTHGIPIDQYKKIKSESSRVINLTCPKVGKVQSIIKKYSQKGYYTIILGDKDHAEVMSLESYAASGVFIISKISDIENLPDKKKYILISQTTLDRNFFDEIV